jgi:hypothetical protein
MKKHTGKTWMIIRYDPLGHGCDNHRHTVIFGRKLDECRTCAVRMAVSPAAITALFDEAIRTPAFAKASDCRMLSSPVPVRTVKGLGFGACKIRRQSDVNRAGIFLICQLETAADNLSRIICLT